MRLFICVLTLSAAALAATAAGSETNPVRTHGQPQVTTALHQVIVKLRAASTATANRAQALSAHDRVANVATRAGLRMREARAITEIMHVMVVETELGAPLSRTLAALRADPEVEYAEADERRFIHAIPDDPLFPFLGQQSSGQWYLQSDASTPSAVNAIAAWDITKGDPSVVIADLDTGVLFDHPDLLTGANGRLLAGYDFITDVNVANDGNGRDPDASDPGDEITTADTSTTQFKGCTVGPSSWHGTRTAGILGALTNNTTGVAGMTWNGKILPVRVLGKCGGYDSDIIAGMLWAAGIAVTGVPNNANPAKIINMSLGATGGCPADYADAISQVGARGVLVVVSAGNEGGAVDAPADCAGVAGIAAIRHQGDKVAFSNLGPQVTVAAPGGNCVNTGSQQPCLYPITSTTNLSTAAPDPNANDYTGAYSCDSTSGSYPGCTIGPNQYRTPNLGTSFSAPIVSGIAALMLSVNSNLNSCQLISRLKESAAPFPQNVSGLSACTVPTGTGTPTPTECLCTNDGMTCGAGMVNALQAVKAALRPIAAVTLPSSVTAGQSVSLSAQSSAAAKGHTISTYQWASVGAQTASITNATMATASVKAPSCGFETVQLTVTDETGAVDTGDVVLSPTSSSSNLPSSATSTACVATPKIQLAICPATSSVQTNGTDPLKVSVAYTTNDAVTWEVNGKPGGDSVSGTVSTSGVYTAPASVPAGGVVTVTALSSADSTVQTTAQLTVTAPPKSGGGSLDLMTLVVGTLALSAGIFARRYARR